jgi:hypothetical protein
MAMPSAPWPSGGCRLHQGGPAHCLWRCVLVVLIHLGTDLTTRALAALCHTSQSTLDRIIHHLAPVLARALRPAADNRNSGQP